MKPFALVLLAACWGTAAPPPQSHGPIEYASSVSVRLAERGDVFPQPTLMAVPALSVEDGCRTTRGDFAPQLYDPILTYLRMHIIRDPSAQAQLIPEGADSGTLGRGTTIWIQPRTQIGALAIETRDGSFGAGHYFCVHVRHQGARTLLILEPVGSWITRRSLAPADRRS